LLGPFPVDLAAEDSVTRKEWYALRTYARPGALIDLGMPCVQTLLALMRGKSDVDSNVLNKNSGLVYRTNVAHVGLQSSRGQVPVS
jgi:hypothetical protein